MIMEVIVIVIIKGMWYLAVSVEVRVVAGATHTAAAERRPWDARKHGEIHARPSHHACNRQQ